MDRPVVMPEVFDGTSDWLTYFQYFGNCGAINGWTPAQHAQILGVRLRGAAETFHAALPTRTRNDWDAVTDALTGRFHQPQQAALHKSAFKNRTRRPEETLSALADDLRRLATRAYPNADEMLRDELARDQFVEAIPSSAMRLRLKEANIATLDGVLAHALHLEALWQSGAASTWQVSMETTSEPNVVGAVANARGYQPTAVGVESLQGLTANVKELEAVSSRLSSAASQFERAVEAFHRMTLANEPQDRRGFFGGRPGQNGQRLPNSKRRACYNCGEPGHFAKDCPSNTSNTGSLNFK